MMFKLTSFFVLALLVVSISFVSAQWEWVETPNFVEVSSEQAGNKEQGCFVANMAGMLASLNNPRIGTNPDPIIDGLRSRICPPDRWPPNNYDLLSAALHFLVGVL